MRAALLLLGVLLMGAAPPPKVDFTAAHVQRALGTLRLQPDPLPEGKRLSFIRVFRYEVFLATEPFPTFPNALHWLTDEDVVRREMLIDVGEAYAGDRVAESGRNLRGMGIFALVQVVPVMAEAPGEVGLVVITRDLWSLRLETDYQLTGGVLNFLTAQLTERNLFGRAKKATLTTTIVPLQVSAGANYFDRWFLGEKRELAVGGSLFFERDSGDFDGASAAASFGRSFRDLRQARAWSVRLQGHDRIERRSRNGEPDLFPRGADGLPVEGAVPIVWDEQEISGSATTQWQTGQSWILRGSGGVGLFARDTDADVPDTIRADFERVVLPPQRRWIYPLLGGSFFQNTFRTYRDLAAFAISEDVHLGASGGLTALLPLRGLGSDQNGLSLSGSLGYTFDWLGDGLAEAAGGLTLRREFGRDGDWRDQVWLLRLRAATPSTAAGRLILRGDWLVQRDDTSRSVVTLGGDNGLRGYVSQQFFARSGSRVRGNAEWRSKPLVYSFLHTGGAVFYDVGDVYRVAEERNPEIPEQVLNLKHDVGVGLRVMFPQFNRVAFRFDVAVPVDGTGVMFNLSQFTTEGGQAVPVTRREDAFYESSVGGLLNQP
jgi:hypothetical protein